MDCMKNLNEMTGQELCMFLRENVGLDEAYITNILDEELDGSSFMEIIENEMKEELTKLIPKMGPRIRTIKMIREYAQGRLTCAREMTRNYQGISSDLSIGNPGFSIAEHTPNKEYSEGPSEMMNSSAMMQVARTGPPSISRGWKHGPDLAVSKSALKTEVSAEDMEDLEEKSKIYHNLDPSHRMYNYFKAMNDAAYKVAQDNPAVVTKKNILMEMAKKLVHESGYKYKKKKSRSEILSGERTDGPKYATSQIRETRIRNLEEDINATDIKLDLMEKQRVKLAATQNYAHAVIVSEQMKEEHMKKRNLIKELEEIQRKEKYLHKKKLSRVAKKTKAYVKTSISFPNDTIASFAANVGQELTLSFREKENPQGQEEAMNLSDVGDSKYQNDVSHSDGEDSSVTEHENPPIDISPQVD